ncbi:glycosyltransferase [Rhodoglobus sp. NPDC076762]
MRIIVQSHSAAPFNFGGAELALVELLDEWRRIDPDAQFLMVVPEPHGGLFAEMEQRGIEIRSIEFDPIVGAFADKNAAFSAEETLRSLSAVATTRRLIREFEADLVITNTIVAPWGALAAQAERVPHLWFAHEYGASEHGLSFRIGRDETFTDIGELSDLVVANSTELHEYLSRWVPRERLRIIHPALAPARVRELGAQPDVTAESRPSQLTVVIAGRIAEPKGQLILLEALAILQQEGLDVRARIIGIFSGGFEEVFRERARTLGIEDRIQVLGDKSNPFPSMRTADVGLSLSFNESFGRVALEYMALGLPVIATRTGVARSLIRDGIDGFVIEPGDVDSLVVALRKFHENTAQIEQMGAAAAEQADVVHKMYPVEDVVQEARRLVVERRNEADLPHSIRALLNSPHIFDEYRAELESVRLQMTTSATWRIGAFVLTPVRILRRFSFWLKRRT